MHATGPIAIASIQVASAASSPRLVKREAGFPNPRRALIGSNQLWRVNDSPYYREYIMENKSIRLWPGRSLWIIDLRRRDITKFNSSIPSAAYMRQWTKSALVHIMACRLFGAKPLPEPTLTYCQWDPWEQTPVKFELNCKIFYSLKYIWNCRLWNGGHFVQGGGGWVNVTTAANTALVSKPYVNQPTFQFQ